MQEIYIFCHGWGLDNHFWDPIRPYFSLKKCIYLDAGYFGEKNINLLNLNTQNVFIGIAHSMGLIKLLSLNIKFKAIIGIHSFINFLGFDYLLRQKRIYALQAMQQYFRLDPKKFLLYFYRKNKLQSAEFNKSSINNNLLLKELEQLYLSINLPKRTPTLILASRNDLVVPINLIADNFINNSNVNIIMHDNGWHNLCLEYSEFVFKKIINFLKNNI